MAELKPCEKCKEKISIGIVCTNFNVDEDYYAF